jgi:hypothetical protein
VKGLISSIPVADHDASDALQTLRTERMRTAVAATVERLPAGMRSLVSLY